MKDFIIEKLTSILQDPQKEGHDFSYSELLSLDEKELFPAKQIQRLDGIGLTSEFVPEELGGKLHDFQNTFEVIRSLARTDLTIAIGKGKTLLGALPVWIGGESSMKQDLAKRVLQHEDVSLALTEKSHGSDLFSTQCFAESTGDGYVLNGEKWLINNATRSQNICVLAKTNADTNPRSFSFFLFQKDLVHAEEFELLSKIKTHGIRGADISGIRFKNCRLPKNALVGGFEGRAFDQLNKTFQISRSVCAALSLGAAEAAFDLVLEFLKSRNLYGENLLQKPVIHQQLTQILGRIWICDALCKMTLKEAQRRPQHLTLLSSVVKYFVPNEVEKIISLLSTLLGARHYLREELPTAFFQKIRRDHSLVPLFDGSGPVNLQNIFNLSNVMEEKFSKNLGIATAPFKLQNLKISRADGEPWWDQLHQLKSSSNPDALTCIEIILNEKSALDEALKQISSLGPDSRWTLESFRVSERRAALFAAAASCIYWSEISTEGSSTPNWIYTALNDLFRETAQNNFVIPEQTLQQSKKELLGWIQKHRRHEQRLGLNPI